jgi:CRISPR-associated exonuclease Cas4
VIYRIIRAKNEFYPVELKTGKPPLEGVYPSHQIQLGFSAQLIERKFEITVPLGFIEYAQINELRPTLITEDLRDEVEAAKDEIRRINGGYIPPKIRNCEKCEYRKVCG